MKTKRDITEDVIFRVFRDGNDVIAFWPASAADNDGRYCQSYQHIGQHSPANYQGCLRATRPATPNEYKDLLKELKQIGYKPNIIKRATKWYDKARMNSCSLKGK